MSDKLETVKDLIRNQCYLKELIIENDGFEHQNYGEAYFSAHEFFMKELINVLFDGAKPIMKEEIQEELREKYIDFD